MIEGIFTEGQTCLIIEDVITTGGSIIETSDELESAGLNIKDVVVLVDREQGGRENLEKKFTIHTILTLTNILETLLASSVIKNDERVIIEKFIAERAA